MITLDAITRLGSSIKEKLFSELANHDELISIEIPMSNITFHELLFSSKASNLFYLKNSYYNEERLALGLCKSWEYKSEDYQFSEKDLRPYIEIGVPLYSSVLFQSLDKDKDDLWNSLAGMTYVLPAIELIKLENKITLRCYCPVSVIKNQENLDAYISDALAVDLEPITTEFSITNQTMTPDYENWESSINKILELIKISSLEKLILARKTTFEVTNKNAIIALLKEGLSKEKDSNIYYQKINSSKTFLAITPENLFVRKETIITCDAIAGTTNIGKTDSQTADLASTLLSNKKNCAEHDVVVEYLTTELSTLCDSVTLVKEKEILKLSYVQHIHSVIQGVLKEGVTDFDLLQILHPTPATGGSPKDNVPLIKEFESFNRGLYAGAVGIISKDYSAFLVGIRSCLMQDMNLHVFSGAGIVNGSNPHEEWEELNIKMKSYITYNNLNIDE
jgi:menaquinone-specific isochorismate synthase